LQIAIRAIKVNTNGPRRSPEPLNSLDTTPSDLKQYEQEEDDSVHQPSSLLEHINAATRSTIVGGPGAALATGAGRGSSDDHHGVDAGHVDGDGWRRSETPAVAAGGGLLGTGQEDEEDMYM
jgi:hypothetical protein